jgi:signal transduction histidine kinase
MERLTVDLSRANAIKDELLGLVSHELRTPLTTIVGMTEVLRRRSTDPESIGFLDDIAGEADRLQRLIENMLVLAQLESDKLAFEPILLQRTVPAQIAEVRRRYPDREIRLDIPDTMLPVIAQPTYVEQVIHNLLTNAAKYSRPDSPIEIRAVEREPMAAILVLDQGEEVDPIDLPRLFEPFFRSSRARHMSGAGLGLAVCKRLVEAQSGAIWARAREGGGLELGFTLPLFDEERDEDLGVPPEAAQSGDTTPRA